MKLTAHTDVANMGWRARSFELNPFTGLPSLDEIELTGNNYISGKEENITVLAVEQKGDGINISFEPFAYSGDFTLTIGGADSVSLTKQDVCSVTVDDLDRFRPLEEKGVIYRLYEPKASGPRPLLLFLHGGGECGSDNCKQMTGTLGALKLSYDYPDIYVLAPQAPGDIKEMLPDPSAIFNVPFANSLVIEGMGWHRSYLASICDVIRGMVSDGRVDANRIVVTGLSMGGGGTLRMLSVGNDLFAAAVPICPSMTPETYAILCGLTDMKIWITAAYLDHTIYRHKYIVDGILALRDAGNRNARFTLFSPEELEKYGLSTDPKITLHEKLSQNHNCWVPTFYNEHGVMDWLVSQSKTK